MLATIELGEQIGHHRRALANGEITEMPDYVVRSDRLVPPRQQRFVHRRHRRERPPIKPQRAAMTKMRVAGEVNRHSTSPLAGTVAANPDPSRIIRLLAGRN